MAALPLTVRKRHAKRNSTMRTWRALRNARSSFLLPLQFEQLESRRLLAADDVISVGRFQSAYSTLDVQNHELAITYTVFNQQETEISGTMLNTRLRPNVSFKSASQAPDQSGQSLSWSLGTIAPYGSASVELIVTLPSILPAVVDDGAEAFGTVNAGFVRDEAPAVSLRSTAIDVNSLAATPDANAEDPVIRAQAAMLDHDPQQILEFLKNNIGYESYIGSLRGSRGTLWSEAGNALDEASLGIALLRASGIPARYAMGDLPANSAQTLISSMFPDSLSHVGYVGPAIEKADPVNDPKLIDEAQRHFWLQFDHGTGYVNADTTFPGIAIGQVATAVSSTFIEVDDALRHKTRIQVDAETYNSASQLFGGLGGGLSTSQVLEAEFLDVEIVGRSLALGHIVSTSDLTTPVFSMLTHSYSPYINIVDVMAPQTDVVIRGTSFQETLTNFPFGSLVLTGLFLKTTLTGPDGPDEVLERALVDRIGFAAREGRSTGPISVDPASGSAIVDADIHVLHVMGGEVPSSALPTMLARNTELQSRLRDLGEGEFPDSADIIAMRYSLISALSSQLLQFEVWSNVEEENLEAISKVHAYYDRPRITIAGSTYDANTEVNTLSFDLRRESMRVLPHPGQNPQAAFNFNATKGLIDNAYEERVVSGGLGFESFGTVAILNAALDQEIPFEAISQDNAILIDNLDISSDAKARIAKAVQEGLVVLTPSRMVSVAGEAVITWLEIDPSTGETSGVLENGIRSNLTEGPGTQAGGSGTQITILQRVAGGFEKAKTFVVDVSARLKNLPNNPADKISINFTATKMLNSAVPPNPGFFTLVAKSALFGAAVLTDLAIPRDPPLNDLLFGNDIPAPDLPTNPISQNRSFAANSPSGAVNGSLQAEHVQLSGEIVAGFQDSSTSSFQINSLQVPAGSVTNANGQVVGSGLITLNASSLVDASISGNTGYQINGFGTLSYYASGADQAAASAEWDQYSATASGNFSIRLLGSSLVLNGQTLPPGAYTISATAATFSGAGRSSAISFSGTSTASLFQGKVLLGAGTGTFSVGGQALSPKHGTALGGFSGNISIQGNSSQADAVAISGSTLQLLKFPDSFGAPEGDQNTEIEINVTLRTSLPGNYDFRFSAPQDWQLRVDGNGKLFVKPAPGLQSGIYFVEAVARSSIDPELAVSSRIPITVNATAPGVELTVEADPVFSVPFHGALIPSAFIAGVRNLGPTIDSFALSFQGVPPSFSVLVSDESTLEVPAGRQATTGFYLLPALNQPLPPPGTVIEFDVIATSQSNPLLTQTIHVTFVMPAVHAVVLSLDPDEIATTPGTTVSGILVISSVGNVPEIVEITTTTSSGLVVDGIANTTLNVGQVKVLFLDFTVDPSVPLNSTLIASFTAEFGGVEESVIQLPVRVVAPGVESTSAAAAKSRDLGYLDLANRLDDLGAALTNLVQLPGNAVFKAQAIASLDAIIGLLHVDPVLVNFVDDLTPPRDQLSAAQTPVEILAALNLLGDELEEFRDLVDHLYEGNFSAILNPSVQTAQPGSPAQFAIILQNIGIATTTYDLTLGALPPGVTGAFSTDSITLAPGEFAPSLFVTLTPPTNELVPFNFDVQISLQNTPQVVKTVHGVMSVRNEFLSVVDVTSDPLYITPGESAAISTRLFNAVNKSQEILVSYVVNDASGAQVFASTETQALLNTQTALLNVDLDSFDSTGLQNGQYTIVVSVTAPDGSPIPGGTGQGIVFVGSPVTATITVSPQDLPQGTSQVTTTLTVEAQIPLQSPLSVVSQIAIGGASDVNRHGDFVYVATSSGIQIYNVAGANIDAPVFVRTISGAQNFLETKGDRLYAISGTNTTKLSIYSLADPSNPALLGATANIPYNAADNMVITDTHVYVSAIQFIFFLNNRDIFDHNGTLLSIDISNPAAPVLDGVLFNENGTNNDGIKSIGGIDQFGGNRNVWTVIQVSPTLLYLAGSTVTGTNTQAGTGIISVIDISNPLSMTVVREVTIPGTVQSLGLSIEGDQAFVTSTSGGWNDFNVDFGFTGNVVITTLDISTLDHPTVTHTETLTRASRGISADNTLLGNGVYAFTSLGATTDQPALFVADASDPDAPLVTSVNVPTEIRRHFSLGDFIYTVSPSGLIIYQVDPIESIPATASVQIPKNNGVTPIPASFSQSPSQIIAGPDFDTYVWNVSLASGVTSRVITWDSTVTNIGSGEVRDNTLATEVAYSLVPSPIQILSLPPTNVIGKQILSLSPALVTIQPGDSAFYLVTVVNPSQFEQNFTLSVEGIPSEWVELLSPITLLPGEETVVSLVIHSDPFAPQADYQFVVTATAGGIRGSVEGDLVLLGDAIVPEADPHSHGIVAELIPDTASTGIGGIARYKLRVTNTGSAPEEYFTVVSGLPPGYLGYVDQSVVEVKPGASNYRDLTLLIETPLNATPNLYSFTVTVGAFGTEPVHFDVGGNLQLLPLGVDAKFSTPVGNPNQTYQLLVKNTGQIAETFDLTLSGPGALIASLATNVVTLAPGASQLVDITVGEPDFSFPGAVQIFGAATARSNGAVFDIDRLEIIVSGAKGLEGAFSEDSIPAQPNPFSALFQVNNTGNLEDQYVAEITGITGALTATFIGFDGNSTPTIPLFRLPGLTGATLALRAFPSGGGGGSITVQIRSLTDETIVATDTLVIGVSNNQPPVITSNGGGDTAEVSIPENTSIATDVNSSDPDLPAQVRTYSLGGGADADKFTIHPQTGILSFKTAPNFEAPTDQGQNNVYEVIVRVTDGLLFDSQAISVRVTNVNEAPTITSGGGGDSASVHVPENTTTAYDTNSADPDLPAQVRTYSLSGPDASFFHLDVISGILSFKSAPNFENPLDQGKNNIYDVSIRVTDGALFDTQSLAIHVTNVNEAPTINSYGGLDSVSLSVPEGTVNAADANSADPDLPAQERTYAISGGADASRFTVDRVSGVVRFVVPPDFEQPIDVGGNNVYNVIVRVTDGELFDTQAYAITVTNLGNESVNYLAVGADAGAASEPLVKVYRPDGSLLEQFHAYETGYLGGVRVATGDVTGDGIIDVVTAPGRGHAPIIKVFDGASIADGVMGNAQELPAFVIQAFDMTFVDGLSIAVGDVVGDGLLDVVAIPDRGQTEVRVFRNRLSDTPHPHPGDAFSNAPWRSFLPFDANFIGGGTVAIGEIDRNLSKNEVIVGSGSGMNATIKAFNVNSPQAKLVKTYTPIDPNFRGGVFVAAGDINGDGIADIVAGGGQGGSSKTSVLDGRNGNSLGAIYPYTDVSKQAPVRVTVRDLNGDGIVDTIFAGHGADGKTKSIRRYDLISKKMSDFLFESDPQMGGGFHLG